MYYRLSKNSFVRKIENFGYIYNQRTKVNVTFTDSGAIFLLALTREAQSLEKLVSKIATNFEGVSEKDICQDVFDFYDILLEKKLIVVGDSHIFSSKQWSDIAEKCVPAMKNFYELCKTKGAVINA